jgi:hypothetical protein
MRLLLPLPLLHQHQHTAIHITTTKATIASQPSRRTQTPHPFAPHSWVAFTHNTPVNKSLDLNQGHGVLGLVYSTDRSVGDTARHCDQGLLSFSLFPRSVCEHCLFLFCTLRFCTYRPWHARESTRQSGRWIIIFWDTLLALYLF